jgi:hypothetical protein
VAHTPAAIATSSKNRLEQVRQDQIMRLPAIVGAKETKSVIFAAND